MTQPQQHRRTQHSRPAACEQPTNTTHHITSDHTTTPLLLTAVKMDSFFFPSSPLFAAHAHALPSVPLHHRLLDPSDGDVDVDADVDAVAMLSGPDLGYDGPDMLFLQQDHAPQKDAGMMANARNMPPTLSLAHAYSYAEPHQAEFWSLADNLDHEQEREQEERQINHAPNDAMNMGPIPSTQTYPHPSFTASSIHSGSGSGSGSGSDLEQDSCSTTPTFVPSHSPTATAADDDDEDDDAHVPVTPNDGAFVDATKVDRGADAQSSQPRSLSLLDQFHCVIPEIETREVVKIKRERGKRSTTTGTATTKKIDHAPLPVFVSRGYASDSSHPSIPSSVGATATTTIVSSGPLLSTIDNDAENNEPSLGDSASTKRRKLSRKAELARLARKRKKTRLGDLEAEVARLEQELSNVKRARTTSIDGRTGTGTTTTARPMMDDADESNAVRMRTVVSRMVDFVHSDADAADANLSVRVAPRGPFVQFGRATTTAALTGSDSISRSTPSNLTPIIDEYMVAYNGMQGSCARHMDQLQTHHIKPMRTFEFIAWLMQQTHDSSASVWSSLLCGELDLNPSSREFLELECFRTSIASQHNFDAELERAFGKMAALVAKRATQQSKNLNRVRSILDEKQFVKMVEWMSREQGGRKRDQREHAGGEGQQDRHGPASCADMTVKIE